MVGGAHGCWRSGCDGDYLPQGQAKTELDTVWSGKLAIVWARLEPHRRFKGLSEIEADQIGMADSSAIEANTWTDGDRGRKSQTGVLRCGQPPLVNLFDGGTAMWAAPVSRFV